MRYAKGIDFTLHGLLHEEVIGHAFNSWTKVPDPAGNRGYILEDKTPPFLWIFSLKIEHIMAFPTAYIHQQCRCLIRAVEQALLDWEPVGPVLPRTHRVAHEGVKVPQYLRV